MEDLTSKVFGEQTVIEFSHRKGDNYYWLVKCNCGSIRPVQAGLLKTGRITNCGCLWSKDLSGKEFHWLTPLYVSGMDKHHHRIWRCKCKCGSECDVTATMLLTGRQKSCGCNRIEFIRDYNTTHGRAYTSLYRVYSGMIKRCYNPNDNAYRNYGGRGICVCDDWKEDRVSFFDWADKTGYSKGLSLDRIDNNGPYSPENCRWADAIVQANNTRSNRFLTFQGRTMTASQWGRELNIPSTIIISRKWLGLSDEEALTTFNRITGKPLTAIHSNTI